MAGGSRWRQRPGDDSDESDEEDNPILAAARQLLAKVSAVSQPFARSPILKGGRPVARPACLQSLRVVPLSPHILLNLPTATLAAMRSGLVWYMKTAHCKDSCGRTGWVEKQR